MRRLLLALLLLSAPRAWGAIAVDSQMSANTGANCTNGGSGCTSLTFSFNNAAGTLLICGAVAGKADGATSISSVTYAGTSMGAADVSIAWYSTNRSQAALYHLVSPATGANNVVVTLSAGAHNIEAGCVSLTGADTTTPVLQTGSAKFDSGAGDTAPTKTITGTTSGSLLIDVMGTGSGETANGQTLTWLANVNGFSAAGNAASQYASGTGGSVVMSYTVTQDYWGIAVVEIAAAGGGGGPTSPVHSGMTGFWGSLGEWHPLTVIRSPLAHLSPLDMLPPDRRRRSLQ